MVVENSLPNGIQRALLKTNRRGTILEGASDGLEFRPKTRRLEGGESFPLILFLGVGRRELFPPAGTTFRINHKMDNLPNPMASPRRPVLSRKPDPDPSARRAQRARASSKSRVPHTSGAMWASPTKRPLTRPAPAGESDGRGPPSPQGRGMETKTQISPQGRGTEIKIADHSPCARRGSDSF
jgi:hypothetical protein